MHGKTKRHGGKVGGKRHKKSHKKTLGKKKKGGKYGGEVVGQGTPEEITKIDKSYTGKFLSKELNSN